MKKQVIQIGLEFVFGPLLKDEVDEYGNESTGSKIVDSDSIVQQLDKNINELWCSLYSKDDSQVDGLKFNKDAEKEIAPTLVELIDNLISRLNEINDGSYVVNDMITTYLKKL